MTAHDAWLTLLCGSRVLVALGSTSGVVNERLWVSEPLACAIASIAIGPVGLGLLRGAARVTLVIAVSRAAMRLPADRMRANRAGLSLAHGPGILLMRGAGALVA